MNNVVILKNDKFLKFYSIAVFFYLLHSMHPWFLLWIPTVWASLLFLSISLFAVSKNYFVFGKRKVSAFLFLVLFLWLKRDANFNGVVEAIINAIIFFTILSLRNSILLYIFERLTKWMAVLVGVSAVAFLLNLIGVPLPHRPLSASGAFESLQTENYFFFINAASYTDLGRFRSVFYEPGYLTLGVASLLFLNKYDIRNKYVLLLLFSQMLSFSLAGFFLLIFGYLFYSICQTKSGNKKNVLKGCLIIVAAFFVLSQIFGESYMQETFYSRLAWEDGTIAGDNRSSEYLDYVYENMMSSGEKWMGTYFDVEYSETGVSGYKLFAVQQGLIGVILTVIAFYSLIPYSKRFGINLMNGAILLILLMLYQNAYPTAFCILFPAACIKHVCRDEN